MSELNDDGPKTKRKSELKLWQDLGPLCVAAAIAWLLDGQGWLTPAMTAALVIVVTCWYVFRPLVYKHFGLILPDARHKWVNKQPKS